MRIRKPTHEPPLKLDSVLVDELGRSPTATAPHVSVEATPAVAPCATPRAGEACRELHSANFADPV
jgi:hypothetical protein